MSEKEDNDSIKEEIEGVDLNNQEKVKVEKEVKKVEFNDNESSYSNHTDSIKEEIEGYGN